MKIFITIGYLAVVLTVSLEKKNAHIESTGFFNKETVTTQRATKSSISPNLTENPSSKPEMNLPVSGQGIVNKTFVSQNMLHVFPMAFIHGKLPSPPPPLMGDTFSFDVEIPIKTILSFCPSSTNCQKKNFTPTYQIGNECCLPCDCSDRCYTAGTCCAEMTNGFNHNHHANPPFTTVEESCVNTFITGGNYISDSSYILFQHCTDNKDNRTENKCLHPDMFKLDEITPVFSLNSHRHYRNVFCAKCNNDEHNVLLWQTRLSCKGSEMLTSGFPKSSSIFSILEFISTNPSCALVSDPPSDVKKVDHCISDENIVSDCNKPILESLCKQSYAPVKAGSIIYRNVFCMECATSSNYTGIYKACYPLRVEEPLPFVSILSLNIDEKTVSKFGTTDNNMCLLPKTYNEKIDSCIHHTCAVTEINVADVYHPIFSKLLNIHLEYRLKLLYRVFTLDILESLPLPLFDSKIMSALGITLDNLCFTNILDVKVLSGFAEIRAVYIKFTETTNIQQSYKDYEDGIEAYNEMAKANKQMVLLQIDKSAVDPMIEDSVTFAKFTRPSLSHYCIHNIAMTKLQFCETVSFHQDEFKLHDNGNISINKLMFVPGEFVIRKALNGTIKYVQVCLEDYISIHKMFHRVTSVAHNTSSGNQEAKWFVFCTLLMYSTNLFI